MTQLQVVGVPGDLAGALEEGALYVKGPSRPLRASLHWATKVRASQGDTSAQAPRTALCMAKVLCHQWCPHSCAGRCSRGCPAGGRVCFRHCSWVTAICGLWALGQSGRAAPHEAEGQIS